MSFNRTKYDKCAYELQMNRSTGEGDYRLYAPFAENCSQCFSETGPIGAKSDVSLVRKPMDLTFSEMAQTESQLSWRNQILQKCNDNTDPFSKAALNHKPACCASLNSEDTRFTHPLDNYRSLSLTGFMMEPYLHVNPQCYVQPINDKTGLNSRLHVKDSYVMPEQAFWDNYDVLPKELPNPVCRV